MRILVVSSCLAVAVAASAGSASGGTSSATGKLRGTYVRTVTKADIARTNSFRHEGPGQSTPPTGAVRLVLGTRTFRFVDSTGFAISQTYSATTSGRLTINAYVNPAKASFCGPEIPQNAIYHWSVVARTLVLKARDDRCADRDSLLTGRWTRVGN